MPENCLNIFITFTFNVEVDLGLSLIRISFNRLSFHISPTNDLSKDLSYIRLIGWIRYLIDKQIVFRKELTHSDQLSIDFKLILLKGHYDLSKH